MTTLIAQLEQLITALDRRIPQVARAGERKIAQEAASLRDAAVARLAQLGASGRRPPLARAGEPLETRGLRAPREQLGDESLLSFVPAYHD
jgi:hypothetical protein